jgi:hypothetical protein
MHKAILDIKDAELKTLMNKSLSTKYIRGDNRLLHNLIDNIFQTENEFEKRLKNTSYSHPVTVRDIKFLYLQNKCYIK